MLERYKIEHKVRHQCSFAAELLSFTRNRLSGQSIRCFLCLGDWSRKDIVSNDIFLRAVKQNMGVDKVEKGKQKAAQ